MLSYHYLLRLLSLERPIYLYHEMPTLYKQLNFHRQRYSQQRLEVSADVSEYSFGIGMYIMFHM